MPAENLHLTLLFLGDVPAEKIEAVRDTAADVAGCRFDLMLDAFRGFQATQYPCPLVGPLRTASGTQCPASITIRKSRGHRLARQQRNLSSTRDPSPQSKPAKKNTGKTEPEYYMDGMPLRPDRIGIAADRLPLPGARGKEPSVQSTEPVLILPKLKHPQYDQVSIRGNPSSRLELQHEAGINEAPINPTRRETGILVAPAGSTHGTIRRLIQNIVGTH